MPTPQSSARHFGLGFKLALFILTSTTLIFAAAFSYNYYCSRQLILKNVAESAKNLAHDSVQRMETVFAGVARIPTFLALNLDESFPPIGELTEFLRDFLHAVPEVYGATVAFEPYAFEPRTRYFAPYTFKDKNDLSFTMLGGDGYDYFLLDWYLIPKELGKPMWSEPYFDEGGGDILMTTLSIPFYRDGGKTFSGVVTADISLDWLKSLVAKISVFNSGYAFLLSKNGVFVAHPENRYLMRESIFSLAEDMGSVELRDIGKAMVRGTEGYARLPEAFLGKPAWVYYAPVPATGWSMGIIVPENELLADLHTLSREILTLGALGFALLFAVIAAISIRITRPLRTLAEKSSEIAKGNLDVDLPTVKGSDEVGELSRSFHDMRNALKDYIANLTETTKAKERMESELKIAKNIQMSFLPKRFPPFPDISRFDLHAALEPAREVGGDLYDFFLLDETHLFFSVGDVSGKGVPAALFMAVTKTLVKGNAEPGMDPAAILSRVNTELCVDNEQLLFVTMFCGILDFTTGELAFSNAGHNPPVLLRADGATDFLELPRGLFLGIMEDAAYRTGRIVLGPGDALVVYTDGVTEAMNEAEELYSSLRLLELLRAATDKSAVALTDTVMESVITYEGDAPQADDITVLALTYTG
ncbi:SpoIIE family protein phosphatase [Desulfovibrio sulfodismutans]|uniref:SpoIIE family protein phosphatase n=1 Tax=Desulfolutivibrio sulfodismutans TaxID=63561 RepID=A0A7K3NGT7_9BACT|nr:SpoIIE family protein phosphatase [Desulfolutivibrio sulfodismutans]NDY55411.1 SpoIIE family protein phosphatase [Desulfolutivibrio sulfodismutans]QLA12216.1 SpoIIE family protein phosphatase [Desulfolutivibrio sulfodismutans DSM 3696]